MDIFGKAVITGDRVVCIEKGRRRLVQAEVIAVDTDTILVEYEDPLGVDVSHRVKTNQFVVDPTEIEDESMTDWRNLEIGDVVWWSGDNIFPRGKYIVSKVESPSYQEDYPIYVQNQDGKCEWIDVKNESWKFIKRP